MKKEKDASTLTRILEAAKSEMSKHGFSNTTVEQITNKADVGKGTFYLYFSTKEDVIKYMMEEMFDRVKTILEQSHQKILEPNPDMNAIIKKTILDTIKEYYELKDVIITVYSANFELSKDLFSFRSSVFVKLRKYVEKIIRISQEKGYIRPIQPEILSYMLFSIFTNIAVDVLFKEGISKLESYVEIIHDFIIHGIKNNDYKENP